MIEMFYRLDITFQGKTIIAIKLNEVYSMPEKGKNPAQQLARTEHTETVGYHFETLKGAANLFKAHARSKDEVPNLLWTFNAWEDADVIYNKIITISPEYLI